MKTTKTIQKAKATIKAINGQETKSAFDLQKLANAVYKIESKSISHVYKQLATIYNDEGELGEIVRQLTGAKFPTFKEFSKAFKGSPCLWYGFGALRKLNPANQRAERVKRQNKATAKKMNGPITTKAKAKVKTAKA